MIDQETMARGHLSCDALPEALDKYLVRKQRKGFLESCRRIAAVGASADPDSKSYASIKRLLDLGLDMVPVVDGCDTYLGGPCYAHLADVPGTIEIVQVYPSERLDCEALAREAVEKKAVAFWMEEAKIEPPVKELLTRNRVHVVELESLEKEFLKHFPLSARVDYRHPPFERGPVRVGARMTENPATVAVTDTIQTAIYKMEMGNFRHLPVVGSKGRLVGMLSDRDIRLVRRSLAFAPLERTAAELGSVSVKSVAIFEPVTIHPDALLERAAELMLRWQVGGLPVIDDAGWLVGIITYTDLLREYVERERGRR